MSGALAPPATLLGTLSASGSGNHVELLGNHAYLANRNTGSVEVVDVSDPANPASQDAVLEGSDFSALDVVSSGGQVLIYAAENIALWVIDASDPGNLVPIGQEPLADFGSAVDVVGSFAYVGDGNAGLKIIDVSNPTNPAPRGVLNTPGFVADIQVLNGVAYLADAGGGGVAADPSAGLVARAAGARGVHLLDASDELAAHPCLDGLDNDGAIDHPADSRCRSKRDDDELLNPPPACGLGFEIALALLALGALRRRVTP